MVEHRATFEAAREYCGNVFHGELVEITSWEKNSAVARLALRTDLWIGYYKFHPQLPGVEGWGWTRTGKENTFSEKGGGWALEEPNNNGGHGSHGPVRGAIIWAERNSKYKSDEFPQEEATDFNTEFYMQWDDRGIDSLKPFVCEKGKFKGCAVKNWTTLPW